LADGKRKKGKRLDAGRGGNAFAKPRAKQTKATGKEKRGRDRRQVEKTYVKQGNRGGEQ